MCTTLQHPLVQLAPVLLHPTVIALPMAILAPRHGPVQIGVTLALVCGWIMDGWMDAEYDMTIPVGYYECDCFSFLLPKGPSQPFPFPTIVISMQGSEGGAPIHLCIHP